MPRVLNHKRDGLPRRAVYIARQVRRYSLPRSKWANPFRLRSDASREDREEVISAIRATPHRQRADQ